MIEDRRTGDTLTETGPRIRLEDQRQLERLAATTALALATARERKA